MPVSNSQAQPIPARLVITTNQVIDADGKPHLPRNNQGHTLRFPIIDLQPHLYLPTSDTTYKVMCGLWKMSSQGILRALPDLIWSVVWRFPTVAAEGGKYHFLTPSSSSYVCRTFHHRCHLLNCLVLQPSPSHAGCPSQNRHTHRQQRSRPGRRSSS